MQPHAGFGASELVGLVAVSKNTAVQLEDAQVGLRGGTPTCSGSCLAAAGQQRHADPALDVQRQRCAVATLPSSPLRESASPARQQQRTAAQNQLGLRRPDAQQLLGPLVAAQASGFHLATAAQMQQGTDQSARAASEILMAIAQKTAAQSLTLLAKEAAALVVALLAPRAPSQSQNFGPGPACATLRARLQHPPGAPASSSLTGQGLVDKGTTLQQLTLLSPFLTGQQGSLPAPRVLMSPNPTLQSPSGCHRVEANQHWTQKVAQTQHRRQQPLQVQQ